MKLVEKSLSKNEFTQTQHDDFIHFAPEEPKTILDLPEDVISIVFKHLAFPWRLKLAETCKQMNDYFGRSQSMKDIKLKLDLERINNDFKLTRYNYSTIKLINFSNDLLSKKSKKNFIRNVLVKLSHSVKEVKLSYCMLSQEKLKEILSAFDEIHSLKLKKCSFSKTINFELVDFQLVNLKEIDVDSVTLLSIQDLLKDCKNLIKIVIREKDRRVDEEMCDVFSNIRDIIGKQKNLKTLDIADGRLFEKSFHSIYFQLKNLALPIPRMSPTQQANLRSFVMTQTSIILMTFNIRVDNETSALIETFNHILQLNSIENLSIVFYPELSQFGRFLRCSDTDVNKFVKKLALNVGDFEDDLDFDDDDQSISALSRAVAFKYPNLENLYINKGQDDFARPFVLLPFNKLKKLQTIEFHNFESSQISKMRLKSLKYAKMTTNHIGNLYQFLNRHRGLESLSIKFIPLHFYFEEYDEDDVRQEQSDEIQEVLRYILIHHPKLKKIHFCLCGEFEFLDHEIIERRVNKYAQVGFELNMCNRRYIK